ncbi:MAG: hypothetical protein M3384_21320 [Acidobacteriota bacterium]|nr:hypothetical protein [Acidobacteriota bacterium]
MNASISFDSKGVIVSSGAEEGGESRVDWERIKSIYVFKKDLLTVDLICLAFDLENRASIELNEDMAGWQELAENLPEYLPGCKSFAEWYMDVAFPAFETKLTCIYAKESND